MELGSIAASLIVVGILNYVNNGCGQNITSSKREAMQITTLPTSSVSSYQELRTDLVKTSSTKVFPRQSDAPPSTNAPSSTNVPSSTIPLSFKILSSLTILPSSTTPSSTISLFSTRNLSSTTTTTSLISLPSSIFLSSAIFSSTAISSSLTIPPTFAIQKSSTNYSFSTFVASSLIEPSSTPSHYSAKVSPSSSVTSLFFPSSFTLSRSNSSSALPALKKSWHKVSLLRSSETTAASPATSKHFSIGIQSHNPSDFSLTSNVTNFEYPGQSSLKPTSTISFENASTVPSSLPSKVLPHISSLTAKASLTYQNSSPSTDQVFSSSTTFLSSVLVRSTFIETSSLISDNMSFVSHIQVNEISSFQLLHSLPSKSSYVSNSTFPTEVFSKTPILRFSAFTKDPTSRAEVHETLKSTLNPLLKGSVPSVASLPNIFPIAAEFDGKLVVTGNLSHQNEWQSLKYIAMRIENFLNEALEQIHGYIYSKVLLITKSEGFKRYVCTFKVFVQKHKEVTSDDISQKIKEYNQTNGFGEFLLISVETSMKTSSSNKNQEKLYLWAIVVLAALGVCVFLLVVLLVLMQRKINKLRSNDPKKPHEINSNYKYRDFYPVFDDADESNNIPLQLKSVQSRNSEVPLTMIETACTDSETDNKKRREPRSEDTTDFGRGSKNVDNVVSSLHARNGTLQIHDEVSDKEDDEDDATKFSTFSSKG